MNKAALILPSGKDICVLWLSGNCQKSCGCAWLSAHQHSPTAGVKLQVNLHGEELRWQRGAGSTAPVFRKHFQQPDSFTQGPVMGRRGKGEVEGVGLGEAVCCFGACHA